MIEDRGLTLDDICGYCARRQWAGALRGRVAPKAMEYSSAPPELRDLLRIELFLSGEFEALARRLSWRVAAGADAGADPGLRAIATERAHFFERTKIEAAGTGGQAT